MKFLFNNLIRTEIMIEIRKQSKDEKLIHGDSFPITVCIGNTCKYLTLKAFEELKTKLNKFTIHDVIVPKGTLCDNCGEVLTEGVNIDYCTNNWCGK